MADISTIILPNGEIYNIKDVVARNYATLDEIEEMCSALELYGSVIWNTDYEEVT